MDPIGRIGAQHHIVRRCDRVRYTGESFLRAQRGNDMDVKIELYTKATGIIVSLGAVQA